MSTPCAKTCLQEAREGAKPRVTLCIYLTVTHSRETLQLRRNLSPSRLSEPSPLNVALQRPGHPRNLPARRFHHQTPWIQLCDQVKPSSITRFTARASCPSQPRQLPAASDETLRDPDIPGRNWVMVGRSPTPAGSGLRMPVNALVATISGALQGGNPPSGTLLEQQARPSWPAGRPWWWSK